jgi:hypothetical protein
VKATPLFYLLVSSALLASACSRSPRLAEGPISINAIPTTVWFEKAVPASEPSWELCYEFNIPGESHQGVRIQAVLVAASGQRYVLADREVDRRGESIVCQVGRIAGKEPGAPGPAAASPIVFEAAELSSNTPLRLRELRGGSRP